MHRIWYFLFITIKVNQGHPWPQIAEKRTNFEIHLNYTNQMSKWTLGQPTTSSEARGLADTEQSSPEKVR